MKGWPLGISAPREKYPRLRGSSESQCKLKCEYLQARALFCMCKSQFLRRMHSVWDSTGTEVSVFCSNQSISWFACDKNIGDGVDAKILF